MFEHVVVIVDGSKTSRYATDASITIARECRGDITFCLTVDPDLFGGEVGVVSFAEMATEMGRRMLDEAAERARAAGIAQVATRILAEDPVHAVVETATAQGSDLIMMGLAPRVGILRPFMRSLAEEILRETAIPLCVMRRPARGRLSRRLLVPIVNDELAGVVVEHAIGIAEQFQAKLIFCSVRRNADDDALCQLAENAKNAAAARGIIAEDLILESIDGIPNTIATSADIQACDAIVMASHVRQGWPRLVEGSVSAAVTYASNVPVILVRKSI